jgi:2-isopropylmalate synthase
VNRQVSLKQLYPACQKLLSFINHPPLRTKAIIGDNAFATEAGIHQSAMLKNPMTYEALKPETFGRSRNFILGRHSGRSLIRHRLLSLGLQPEETLIEHLYSELVLGEASDERLQKLLETV